MPGVVRREGNAEEGVTRSGAFILALLTSAMLCALALKAASHHFSSH